MILLFNSGLIFLKGYMSLQKENSAQNVKLIIKTLFEYFYYYYKRMNTYVYYLMIKFVFQIKFFYSWMYEGEI